MRFFAIYCLVLYQLFSTGRCLNENSPWIKGRATWYEHPRTGSCGLGRLDENFWKTEFGVDAVAAMPDVYPEFNSSCGRCYEIKCRGIQAISADGSVNLNRYDACFDTSKSVVIKIVDTCPCHGNEQWCCGDTNGETPSDKFTRTRLSDGRYRTSFMHLDLSKWAFERLASPGVGIIGLHVRPVPCVKKFRELSPSDWQQLTKSVDMGASPYVLKNGIVGLGWEKTVYGDARRAMYTYDPSVYKLDDGSKALCTTISEYGGFDFHSQKHTISTIANSKRIEFWAKSDNATMDGLTFMANNLAGGGCWPRKQLSSGYTNEENFPWKKFSFSTSEFICADQKISGSDLNRLHWENTGSSVKNICVKDVTLVL